MSKCVRVFVGWALALIATGASAAGAKPEQVAGQAEARHRLKLEAVGNALVASGAPRQLFAAWLLAPSTHAYLQGSRVHAPQVDAWLTRAQEGDPKDPLIAAAVIERCIATGNCAVDAARATLETDDADELASQLLLMRLAEYQRDAAGAAQAWQRAVQARHYRDPLAARVRLLEQATAKVAWPSAEGPGEDREQDRIGTVLAVAGIPFPAEARQVSALCRAPAQADGMRGDDMRGQCRQVLTLLAGGTSVLMARIGAAGMAELDADAAARAQWSARYRALEWTHSVGSQLLVQDAAVVAGKLGAAQFADWIAGQGELPAMQRLLGLCGEPLQPPANWQIPAPGEPSSYRTRGCR